jgi:HJR/Mrr/RecB family endonuclease
VKTYLKNLFGDDNEKEQQKIRDQITEDNSSTFIECVHSYLKVYPDQATYSSPFQNLLFVLKEKGMFVSKDIDDLRYELNLGIFADPSKSDLLKKQAKVEESNHFRDSLISIHIEEFFQKSEGIYYGEADEIYEDGVGLPGRRDPLFNDALECVIKSKRGSTSLLQRHLRIGYGRAAAILDAMVREGYLGEMDGSSRARPVLASAYTAHLDDKNVTTSNNQKFEAFQRESSRLVDSEEYRYIEQFAKKYGRNINKSELSKLRELLISRGFEFSTQQLTIVLSFALSQQRCGDAKARLLRENPYGARGLIKTYLNFYGPDDDEMLGVLEELLIDKQLYHLLANSRDALRKEVGRVHKEIELEQFEKRLLNEDSLQIEEIDSYTGYEFESFLNDLFSRMGFSVEQTKLSGDQGADVVVIKFGEKTVIQAKRFQGNVGNSAVQEIMAAISLYNAHKGMVITNSYYTSSAKDLAFANNIELVDRDGLEEMIRNHW